MKIHRIRLADEVQIITGNISEIMDLILDNLGGTKYSLRLGPNR
jgi:hypothetical protein